MATNEASKLHEYSGRTQFECHSGSGAKKSSLHVCTRKVIVVCAGDERDFRR